MPFRVDRVRLSAVAGCVASAIALWPEPLYGQPAPPPRARLIWRGGPGTEGCIDRPALQRAVEERLGRPLFVGSDSEPAAVTLEVELEHHPNGARFLSRVGVAGRVGADAVRELEVSGDDCRALDEPLALVVSLMADSELARAKPPPPEPTDPDYERTLKRPVLTVPSLQAPPTQPWRASLELDVLAGLGVLPDLAGGAQLVALIEPPRFIGLLVHGAAFAPDSESLPGGGSVSFWLGYAGLALCPELGHGARATLWLCIGGDAGTLRVQSEGLESAGTTYRLVLQSDVSLRGRLELGGRWVAGASLAAALPLRPETIRYERAEGGTEKVFQMAHLALLAGVGVGATFR